MDAGSLGICGARKGEAGLRKRHWTWREEEYHIT